MNDVMIVKDINVSLSETGLRKMYKKYHLEEDAKRRLLAIYQAMLPLVKVEARVCRGKHKREAYCAVTLGSSLDALQELYSTSGAVMEAYMIECLAMEMLGRAYCQFAEVVWEREKRWLDEFAFFGDSRPIEEMPQVLAVLESSIQCNEAMVLAPSKSVVFTAVWKKEKGNGHGSVCRFCNNVSCPMREVISR